MANDPSVPGREGWAPGAPWAPGEGHDGTGGPERRPPGVAGRRRRLGAAGEELVARWYEAAGYQILDRNWRCAEGELDLVCRRGPTVAVVEVKTRSSTAYGPPASAVTRAKQRRIRRLAARWLRQNAVRCHTVRFDVASVMGGRVDVVAGAF
ncbi:MAG: YraN family protein [Acidimicrobiales bacterium]